MFTLDESDPRFLLVYTGDEHPDSSDYQRLLDRWAARAETETTPFGVLILLEDHEHHEDEERNGEEEERVSKLINDFRHSHRDLFAKITLGFGYVGSEALAKESFGATQEDWERAQEATSRFAQYMFGIPGRNFTDLEVAKQWMLDQGNREFVAPPAEQPAVLDTRVGLFYGSTTGVTEYIALKVQGAWQAAGLEAPVAVNIGDATDAAKMLDFPYLLVGVPTWNIGKLQDDWAILFPQLDQLDFTNKQVAFFGIGDQYNYGDNYLDAMGIVAEKFQAQGANLHGFWEVDGYEFAESKAVWDGKFVGLAIDEVNQDKLTDSRIQAWVAQVIQEFALQAVVTA